MTFSDIFKSSFLEKTEAISVTDILIALALSFVFGLFIFFVYKVTYQGIMYSSSFGVTLISMSMITSLVIIAVTSNVVLSLGMVGALSIVRFRTAIKEPTDIAFLFWAIANGIVFGAGLIPLAVIGSVMIGAILLIFASKKHIDTPYILVVNFEKSESEREITETVAEGTKKRVLKSKNVAKGYTELTYEVRTKNGDRSFVDKLSAIDGVNNAVLVSYNGEYMS